MDERLYGALGVKPLILLSTIRHEFYAPHSIIASGLKYSLSLMISFTNPGKSLIKPKIFILQGIFAIKVLHYNIAFNYCVYQKGCLGRNPFNTYMFDMFKLYEAKKRPFVPDEFVMSAEVKQRLVYIHHFMIGQTLTNKVHIE